MHKINRSNSEIYIRYKQCDNRVSNVSAYDCYVKLKINNGKFVGASIYLVNRFDAVKYVEIYQSAENRDYYNVKLSAPLRLLPLRAVIVISVSRFPLIPPPSSRMIQVLRRV